MDIQPFRSQIIFIVVAAAIFLPIFSVSGDARIIGSWDGGVASDIPGPLLLYPVTDHIDLGGKEYLEFKWRRGNELGIREYEFKLYRGYATTAQNLLFKKRIAVGDYPVVIPAKELDLGQVYTWVLIEIFDNGIKSDRSATSFKIVKK